MQEPTEPGPSDYLHRLVDHVPSMLAYWGADLRCRFANRAYEVWFGVDPDALVGRLISDLLGPQLFALNEPYIQAALRGEFQSFERVVPGPDGVQRHSLANYIPDVIDGVVRGFMAQVTDVTALKQTQAQLQSTTETLEAESRRRRTAEQVLADTQQSLAIALASIGAGFVATDREGRITRLNTVGEQLFGCAEAQARGRILWEVFVREDRPASHLARNPLDVMLEERVTVADRHEVVAVAPDGRRTPIEVKADLVKSDDGEVRGLAIIFRGLSEVVRLESERKQAEQAQRESETLAKASMDALPAHICVLDQAGTIVAVNQAWRDFAAANGDDPARVGEGTNYLAICAAATGAERAPGEAIAEGIRSVAVGAADRFDLEYACHSPEQQRWFRASVTRLPDGRAPHVVVSHFDITERVQAERKAQDQKERAEALLESAPDPVVIVNGEGRIVVVNAGTEAVFGYARAELLGQPVEMLLPQRLNAAHVAQRAPYQENPQSRAMGAGRELLARRKGGSEFAVDVSLSPLETPEGTLIISTVRDVTARQAASNALRFSEQRMRLAIDAAEVGVWEWNVKTDVILWDARMFSMYGIEPTKDGYVAYSDWRDAVLPEDLPEQEAVLQQTVQGRGNSVRDFRIRRRSDGSVRFIQANEAVRTGPDGEVSWVVGTNVDVTGRREAEKRIQGQLEHLALLDQITRSTGERQDLKSIFQVVVRSLEDSLPIDFGCVCLHDATINALSVISVGVKSATLAHELAMPEQSLIGIDQNGLSRCVQGQLVYEPDISKVPFAFPERLARGGLRSVVMAPLKSENRVFGVLVVARRDAHAFSSVECEFLRQLSEHVALAAQQAQLYESLQQAYDDLRKTQVAAMQEERLRALGQMASGIAHDINNALSPVSLYTEMLLETEKGLSERARGHLTTIGRAVEDVAHTVARMREVYRQREEQIELAPVDVNLNVQQVLDLTKAHWNDMAQGRGVTIRVDTELAAELPRIMAVASEVREALTNLVLNAVDAMPEGGTLTLRTRLTGAAPEQSVIVEVVDSGIGMDEETRKRCLEPFFTTKGERGTGLGLAMVFGMVQRHSAAIEIDSAPGAGATMRLVFAALTAVIVEPGQALAAAEAPQQLRLLLVDDDPVLLNSLRDTLEIDGHIVVATNGGQAGIIEFRASLERGAPYAAVITDLGMPNVDGRRVAAAVKEAAPATPVILLTGWGQRLIAEGDIPAQVDRVLAKPPKLRELREALAQLCRAAQA